MNILELHQLAAKEWHAGNKGRAIDILEGAIQNNPENPWLVGEMGGLLIDMGRKGVGQALLTHACSMERANGVEDWRHWSTLASTLESLEQREMAELAFQEAVRVDPEVSDIYDQWAGVYVNNGDPKRCIELSKKALSLNPDNVVAKKHLSLGLLEAGQWCEAWPLMENRKLIRDYQRPKYPLPEWTGGEVDTLIVHGEQGIGDEIMYASLLHRIRKKVRRLIVEVTPRLVPLMRRSLGQIGCEVYASLEEIAANGGMEVADIAPKEALDFSLITIGDDKPKPSIISCASLPYVLGLSRQNALSPGYLLPDAARVDHWREKLEKQAAGRRIVGVTWEGGVRKTHKKVRNPPYEAMRDFIASHPQYCWVSVQYTHGEITHKSMPNTVHYQQAVDDLDEQAALISALDLLVSVPQTAVHIAGAMAVPTITLVSSKPRWDFCSDTDQMPWWESVKMISQQGSEWGDVFARLDAALLKRFPHSNVIVEAAE
jgi:tetratricopeptide (TPR) repeat protein